MKKIIYILFITIIFFEAYSQNVNVTSTIGTINANYSSISQAFSKINDGTHKGIINIIVKGNVTEPITPIPLLRSGSVAVCQYTSIFIGTHGNNTVSSANTRQNFRGVIELNSVQNVEINGDDTTNGTTNSLTFSSVVSTSSNTSLIRIMSTNAGGCENLTIKNCNFKGQRGSSSVISNSYCILFSSNSNTAFQKNVSSKDINISNNTFQKEWGAIYFFGDDNSPSKNIDILNNTIGTLNNTNAISNYGIRMVGTYTFPISIPGEECQIENNEIIVGYSHTSPAANSAYGIFVEGFNERLIISKNKIHDIRNYHTTQQGVFGINISDGTAQSNDNININGNFIFNIFNRKTNFTNLPTTSQMFGIFLNGSSATNLKIDHNSIYMNSSPQGTATNYNSYCLASSNLNTVNNINKSSIASMRNNIFANNSSSLSSYGIYLSTDDFLGNNTKIDNNCYFSKNGNIAGTDGSFKFSSLKNWQEFLIFNNLNFELNSITELPPFVNDSNLHIDITIPTKINKKATFMSSLDIDNTFRLFGSSDIGADEFNGIDPILANTFSFQESVTSFGCNASANDVTLNLIEGNVLTKVNLLYRLDNSNDISIPMTKNVNNQYIATIPIPVPNNAKVSYLFQIIHNTEDTIYVKGNDYSFENSKNAFIPNVTVDTFACNGSNIPVVKSFPITEKIVNSPYSFLTNTYSDITEFQFNNNTNISALQSLSGSIGLASGTASEFSNFTDYTFGNVLIGNKYSYKIKSTKNIPYRSFSYLYLDINGDGYFSTNELLDSSVNESIELESIDRGNILIPTNTAPGLRVIRIISIMKHPTNPNLILDGEVEDYKINVASNNVYKWIFNNVNSNDALDSVSVNFNISPYVIGLSIENPMNCNIFDTTLKTINQSASTISGTISHNGSTSTCIFDTIDLTSTVLGGCKPYTYSWYDINNVKIGSEANLSVELTDTNSFKLVFSDANGLKDSITTSIFNSIKNKIDTLKDLNKICERGVSSFKASFKGLNTDSVFWYKNPYDNKFDYIHVGRSYTSEINIEPKYYYARSRKNTTTTIGRPTLGGVLNPSVITKYSGLSFTTDKPVIFTEAKVFIAGTNIKLIVGIVDKSGKVIKSSDTFKIATAATTVATTLNFDLGLETKVDDYRLVLLYFENLTDIKSSNNNVGIQKYGNVKLNYGVTNGVPNNFYTYFYSIKTIQSPCFSPIDSVYTNIIKSRSRQIYKQPVYTKICDGDSTYLYVVSDSMATEYNWFKDNSFLSTTTPTIFIDSAVYNFKSVDNILYKDTFLVDSIFSITDTIINGTDTTFVPGLDSVKVQRKRKLSYSVLKFPFTNFTNVGNYYCLISSDSFCTRDSSTYDVKFDLADTTVINPFINKYNFCVGSKISIPIDIKNYDTISWYKNGVFIGDFDTFEIDSAKYSDQDLYSFSINNKYNCNLKNSDTLSIKIHAHPSISNDINPYVTLCSGGLAQFKATFNDAQTYEWYKNGSIIQNEKLDSLFIYNPNNLDTGRYQVKALSYQGCNYALSSFGTLSLFEQPTIGYFPPKVFSCKDERLTIPSVHTKGESIEWYKGSNLIYTGDSLIFNSIKLSDSGDYTYKVKATSPCKDVTSSNINLTIYDLPSTIGNSQNLNLCEGDSLDITIGSISANIFDWYKDGIKFQTNTNNKLFIYPISTKDNGIYTLKLSSNISCPSKLSNPINLSVSKKTNILTQPIGSNFCENSTVNLKIDAEGYKNFSWYKDGVSLANNNKELSFIGDVSSEGTYFVRFENNAPCPATTFSDPIEVKIKSTTKDVKTYNNSVFRATEFCTDNDGWTYYSSLLSNNDIVFALKKNENIIKTTVDIGVLPKTFHHQISNNSSLNGSFLYSRYWNLNIEEGEIFSPFDVKFYYPETEYSNFVTTSTDLITQNYNKDFSSQPVWIKTKNNYFNSSLLNKVRGEKLNFDVDILETLESGIDGITPYFIFNNLTSKGGGTAWLKYKAGSSFLTTIKNKDFNLLNVNVYPTIVENFEPLTIEIVNNNYEMINLEVYNSLGQLLISNNINHINDVSTNKLQIETLQNGNYFLIIKNSTQQISRKFIVNR